MFRKLEDKLSKPKFQSEAAAGGGKIVLPALRNTSDSIRNTADSDRNTKDVNRNKPAAVDFAPVHVTSFLAPDMDLPAFHAILSQKFAATTDNDLR